MGIWVQIELEIPKSDNHKIEFFIYLQVFKPDSKNCEIYERIGVRIGMFIVFEKFIQIFLTKKFKALFALFSEALKCFSHNNF